jgi:orotidine-5'-phosphate decarboxylase
MRGVPQTNWLDPAEADELFEAMLNTGLIKHDNKRSLPLAGGGTTDVYINERDMRSHPACASLLTRAFENPLRRLRLDRFVEIPEAMSGLAGALSQNLGMPYISIRKEEKAGRVSRGKIIGAYNRGDRAAMIDDVVTDGKSKIVPYQECLRAGIEVPALVVLVDRQQGWQATFKKEGINLPVWAGMTLHQIRRRLIERNIMQRCDPEVEAKNPIIVALDGKTWDEILPLIDQLRTTGCILKVNDLLFLLGIQALIPDLSVYGRVMADLKYYDIPNTVANACRLLRSCPPWAVTVHASGGEAMIKAAVEALAGTQTIVLAVTVLTSFNRKSCREIYHTLPWAQVKVLAAIAWRAGARGFVCSPEEAPKLRKLYPGAKIVTPGVRSPGADKNDQARTDTPENALTTGGANYVVMGRQILGASNPVAEVHRVLTEELKIIL